MVDRAKLRTALDEMTRTPLFHLFGASKELFHSNFLYWLSLLNSREFLKVICPAFTYTADVEVKREENVSGNGVHAKLDFLIRNSKGEIVAVENKVKDFADQEQLARILHATVHRAPSYFVLLTLFKVLGQSFPNWEILDYGKLSSRIEPGNFTADIYYQNLIADYKAFTRNLSNFASILVTSEEYDFAIFHDHDLFSTLNEHKLWEGYQKMRSSHLLMVYNRDHNPGWVQTAHGVNHQKATVDFYIVLKNDTRIGIQVENDQYRKFIRTEGAARKIETLIEQGIVFSPDFRTIQKKPYLNYGDVFKYQYSQIESRLAFDSLFKQINRDLLQIMNSRELIESKIG